MSDIITTIQGLAATGAGFVLARATDRAIDFAEEKLIARCVEPWRNRRVRAFLGTFYEEVASEGRFTSD